MRETELKEMSITTSTKSGMMENEVPLDLSKNGLSPQSSSSAEQTQKSISSIEKKNFSDEKNNFSNPWDLNFWNSSDWEKINARLDYLERIGRSISPSRDEMFTSLERTERNQVRVCVVGQDPYPNKAYATGVAFSVPQTVLPKDFPVTLKSIFSEYCSDLSLPYPTMGDLSRWTDQGVLLWNAIPSTTAGESLAHDWREYDNLTLEVLNILDGRGVVFAFLGAVPRRYAGSIRSAGSRVIECSHPSPRGSLSSRNPFRGSRLFSKINYLLREIGQPPIDWRLP